MTEKPNRNWSAKTLYKQLVRYLRTDDSDVHVTTVRELLDNLRERIVEEETGEALDS